MRITWGKDKVHRERPVLSKLSIFVRIFKLFFILKKAWPAVLWILPKQNKKQKAEPEVSLTAALGREGAPICQDVFQRK